MDDGEKDMMRHSSQPKEEFCIRRVDFASEKSPRAAQNASSQCICYALLALSTYIQFLESDEACMVSYQVSNLRRYESYESCEIKLDGPRFLNQTSTKSSAAKLTWIPLALLSIVQTSTASPWPFQRYSYLFSFKMDSETNHRATKILAEVGGQDMAADAALVKGLVTDSAERMDEEENKEFVTIGWRYLGKADANLHESKHPTQIQLPFPSIVDSPPTLITSQSPVPADSFPSFPHPSPSPSTNLGSIKEIITIIADNLFLTNDDEALVIMGLVCKTWRNSVGIELKKAEKRLEKADDKQLDLFTPRQRRLLK